MGWKTEENTPGISGVAAVTYGLRNEKVGRVNEERGQKVHIALNANMCLLDTRRVLRDVVAVLVHEMIVSFPLAQSR